MSILIVKPILHTVNFFVVPIYLLLSITAALSSFIPLLDDLASHGKTRYGCKSESNKPPKRNFDRILNRWNKIRQFLVDHDALLVSKQAFLHFYLIGLMSLFSLLYVLTSDPGEALRENIINNPCEISVANRENQCHSSDWPKKMQSFHTNYPIENQLAICFLIFHLLRRCMECSFLHCWKSNAKMHLSGYFLGIFHYLILPFVFLYIFPPYLCTQENDKYGFHKKKEYNAVFLTHYRNSDYSPWRIFWSIMLFLLSQIEQHVHHRILADLRRSQNVNHNVDSAKACNEISHLHKKIKNDFDKNKTHPTATIPTYSIPNGRLFKYVACPHYFAEIITYISFFMLLDSNSSSHLHLSDLLSQTSDLPNTLAIISQYKHYALLLWVTTNLVISSHKNHKWYRQTYGSKYPKNRRRIMPFLW